MSDRPRALCAAAALALLALHFGGTDIRDTPLHSDVRFFVAGGRLISRGDVPYRDFVETKPPLAPLASAGLEILARGLGTEPLSTVRVGFLLVAAIGGFLQFRALRRLAGGCAAGLLGALCWTAFPLLRALPGIGAVPKLLMVVFATASSLLALQRCWLLAGAAAALAALDWQPGAFVLVGLVAAALREDRGRGRALGRILAGLGLVLGAVVLALLVCGALGDAWRQSVVAIVGKGVRSLGRHGLDFRLSRIARTMAPGVSGQGWLVAVAAVGMILFAARVRRVRDRPERRLAWPLAAHHYGIAAFSLVDFQGYGDLLALLATASFFAAFALAEALRVARSAAARLVEGEPGRAARASRATAVVFLALLAGTIRPGLAHPDPFLGRDRRRIPTLGRQREVAAELARVTAGRRVGFVSCAEMLYLADVPNLLPLVRWNPPIHAVLRRSPAESPTETLFRMVEEAGIDAIVCPDRWQREALEADPRWERVVLAPEMPRRIARVLVFLRRDPPGSTVPGAGG